MRRWRSEGFNPHVIAVLLGRHPKMVRERLAKPKGRVGRPAMAKKEYKVCVRALNTLQKQARGLVEVTAAMVKRKAGLPYCEKTIRDTLRAHGKPLRKLREKPVLKPEDVAERLKFAEKHHHRPKEFWLRCPHAVIGNKRFPMYLDQLGREYAARRSVRGAYRSGSDAVQPHLVKPKGLPQAPRCWCYGHRRCNPWEDPLLAHHRGPLECSEGSPDVQRAGEGRGQGFPRASRDAAGAMAGARGQ